MKTALIIGGVCIAALITLHHQLYYHFRAVDKGKLYRCGKLSRAALWLVCKHYNIKTVINLMRQDELGRQWYDAQKSFCEQAGIGYFCVPFSAPPPCETDENEHAGQIRQLLDIMDERANHPILIHCKQGVLRTGLAVAIYQKHYLRMDNKTILAKMPNFGHNFQSARYRNFQRFILSYRCDE